MLYCARSGAAYCVDADVMKSTGGMSLACLELTLDLEGDNHVSSSCSPTRKSRAEGKTEEPVAEDFAELLSSAIKRELLKGESHAQNGGFDAVQESVQNRGDGRRGSDEYDRETGRRRDEPADHDANHEDGRSRGAPSGRSKKLGGESHREGGDMAPTAVSTGSPRPSPPRGREGDGDGRSSSIPGLGDLNKANDSDVGTSRAEIEDSNSLARGGRHVEGSSPMKDGSGEGLHGHKEAFLRTNVDEDRCQDAAPAQDMIPEEDMEVMEVIGQGRFATMRRALWHGRVVAVKTVELPPETPVELLVESVNAVRGVRGDRDTRMMGRSSGSAQRRGPSSLMEFERELVRTLA